MEDGRWKREDELLTLLCGDGLAGANGGNVKLSFLAHAAFYLIFSNFLAFVSV